MDYGLQEVAPQETRSDSVTWFLPPYSSMYFRDKVAAGMGVLVLSFPQERWFSNLTTKGNTGSASVYIMLEELFHSGNQPG